MRKLLWLLMLPSALMSQEVKATYLSDNATNETTSQSARIGIISVKNQNAWDSFGSIISRTGMIILSGKKAGLEYSSGTGVTLIRGDSSNKSWVAASANITRPYNWNSKNPYSLSTKLSYGPLDDLARFSRTGVGVGKMSVEGDVFINQTLWIRNHTEYQGFTDNNTRVSSTANVRKYDESGVIYGTQLYYQSYKFDSNLTPSTGYWSPDDYRSVTVDVGYKRPWNSKIRGQILASLGHQRIDIRCATDDNHVHTGAVGGIQVEGGVSNVSVWGNYNSNGSVNGIRGYKWWSIGTSVSF